MKIGITADCSSGLEYAPFKHNIKITRTTIHFGEKELVDGIDITADEFYKELEASDIVPSTSAPTPKEIIRCVEEYRKEGYTTVIHFPISFGLSAYGENLQAFSDDYVEGINLKLNKNQSLGIIGSTGSGKSTFINYINFKNNKKGKILINNPSNFQAAAICQFD